MHPFHVIVQFNITAGPIMTVIVRAGLSVVILLALARAGGEMIAMLVGRWERAPTYRADVRVHTRGLRLTLLLVQEVPELQTYCCVMFVKSTYLLQS